MQPKTQADTLEALAAALNALVVQLDQAINDLYNSGQNFSAGQVQTARDSIDAAATNITNAAATAALSDDAFNQLSAMTTELTVKANAIAKDEQNVARITGIASGILNLAASIASGNVAGVITGVGQVTKIFD